MHSHGQRWLSALFGATVWLGFQHAAPAGDALSWPPITSQTRPWAWWWWHGSAVDQTNIAHELQRFHDAGLGGVQITSIYGTKGAEAREIPYLTPRWLEMMGYTVDEAGRLGMGVDMSLGSGWCFGGPTVSEKDANASVIVKTFVVAAGDKLPGKFNHESTQALVAFSADVKAVELTDKINASGEVDWTAPHGNWTVYALSQKPSGQKVKRPAIGGEGWMLNPAYPQAMQDWLRWFDLALAQYHGAMPQAVFQDSYEYRTDWAPDFLAQFAKRRGYPLQTELPALFGETQNERAARVKYDYRLTLSEVMAQQSEPAWIQWAHAHGLGSIYQAHGTPANWLDLYGDADMPETEMFHNDRNILISKFASSAAHTQGHPLTGAETGTWLKEHFTETLADVKYLADDMFLAGVNRIFYHGDCYSPDDAAWPGWLFYAATEMNPRNPIWHDVRGLNDYIARCQSILQAGRPDNNVLLYWPVADFWSDPTGRVLPMSVSATTWFENQGIGHTAHELWNRGFAFDYLSDAQLQQAKAVAGGIQLAGGTYQTIVVPECKAMLLATFKQLLALARGGVTVVFEKHLPSEVPGLGHWEKEQAQLKKLEAKLAFSRVVTPLASNGDGDFNSAAVGRGRILTGNVELALQAAQVRPETMAVSGLSYVRRATDDGYDYFIANRGATDFDGWITPAHAMPFEVLLDPMTGGSGIAAVRANAAQGTEVHLQLAAGQAIILRARTDKVAGGQAWSYRQTLGQPVTINGSWQVSFLEGGPSLPAEATLAQPASWTTLQSPGADAFAGTARYATTFSAPATAGPFELNLGEVHQSARVRVNGKDYGTLIAPPFRVVVDQLQPAGNTLEVEVTSVAANRIRDLDRRGVNWKIFKDINLVDINYHPFNAADWPITECGLLGPVTLTPVAGQITKELQ